MTQPNVVVTLLPSIFYIGWARWTMPEIDTHKQTDTRPLILFTFYYYICIYVYIILVALCTVALGDGCGGSIKLLNRLYGLRETRVVSV